MFYICNSAFPVITDLLHEKDLFVYMKTQSKHIKSRMMMVMCTCESSHSYSLIYVRADPNNYYGDDYDNIYNIDDNSRHRK